MVSVISSIVKNEGVTKLYRGIIPPILMEAPKRAIKFASNSYYQRLLTDDGAKPLGQMGALLAGTGAGVTVCYLRGFYCVLGSICCCSI